MFDWQSWIGPSVTLAVALLIALVVIIVSSTVMRVAAKRRDWAKALVGSARHPFRLLITVLAIRVALAISPLPDEAWRRNVNHLLLIVLIGIVGWLVATGVGFFIQLALSRYRIDVADNRVARKMQTQLTLVRRLAVATVVIITVASILLTFDGVKAIGTSVLASAGVVSIVAGLAAQSTLANVFAGVQLAFSDAIRLDDVVIVEDEWGKIEEITLTYVVVRIWDDRRLVLPSTYFTNTPFENWTRHSSELLGSIEFDLDWRVSPSEMRVKLDEVLADTSLWDGRAHVLQVTDAVGGFVRIRILVTAIDAPTLFDLRCHVREQMVEWVHTKDAGSLPVTRVQMVEESEHVERVPSPATDTVGLFTGSPEAEKRAVNFTSAIPVQRDVLPDATTRTNPAARP
jgi:small-conductance mechanosensitive channel